MSRRGNCWDNAPQKSFFAVLKTETDLKLYKTYEQLAKTILDYIIYHNIDRPQWDLNKMTPNEYDNYLSKRRNLLFPAIISSIHEIIYI